MFVEAPVSSLRDEATSVDVDTQGIPRIHKFHLAESCLVVDRRCCACIGSERKAGVIQISLSVTVRPPKLKSIARELRKLFRTEEYLLFGIGW